MKCDKCDNCDRKGMCVHAASAHDGTSETININKNGADIQAKLTMNVREIVLEIEGDIFIITRDDLIYIR